MRRLPSPSALHRCSHWTVSGPWPAWGRGRTHRHGPRPDANIAIERRPRLRLARTALGLASSSSLFALPCARMSVFTPFTSGIGRCRLKRCHSFSVRIWAALGWSCTTRRISARKSSRRLAWSMHAGVGSLASLASVGMASAGSAAAWPYDCICSQISSCRRRCGANARPLMSCALAALACSELGLHCCARACSVT